jgi:hypothetical protein
MLAWNPFFNNSAQTRVSPARPNKYLSILLFGENFFSFGCRGCIKNLIYRMLVNESGWWRIEWLLNLGIAVLPCM